MFLTVDWKQGVITWLQLSFAVLVIFKTSPEKWCKLLNSLPTSKGTDAMPFMCGKQLKQT